MVKRVTSISIEEVVHYHLDQIRRYGKGWRAPQVQQHRQAIISLIRLRRYVRQKKIHITYT